MKYGCIGEKLGHSFSKEIHACLSDYQYDLRELAPAELDDFFEKKDFSAINVTIPYKQAVIPYLTALSPEAAAIGAVNTIVNRDGKLYGYNTDFYGITSALSRMGVSSLEGKKVLILGTGGTSLTARAVAAHLGAKQIVRVSRTAKEDAVTYEAAARLHADASLLINATPSGMFPHAEGCPLSLSDFSHLEAVFDAVYNPLRTNLVAEARTRGICAMGGLYMLVAQAKRAVEIFLDKELPDAALEHVFHTVHAQKENIVLIGMPASGKSTVGRALAESLGREFIDLDEEVVKRTGKDIPTLFAERGESGFRQAEADTVLAVSDESGKVIATGGGVVLREENVRRLKRNGRLVFLDRPLSMLLPTKDRPTASNGEAIRARYDERIHLYRTAADVTVDGAKDVNTVVQLIRKELSL